MTAKVQRPPLPSRRGRDEADDDEAAIQRLAAQHNLIPSRPAAAPSPDPDRDYPRPAPIAMIQLKLPDYVKEQLTEEARDKRCTVKEVILHALRRAGYRVDNIDLRDLRRR